MSSKVNAQKHTPNTEVSSNEGILTDVFPGDSSAQVETKPPVSDAVPKQKKRRRTFSCSTCRKLKTKCIYGAGARVCDRCSRLRLDCSLPPSLRPDDHIHVAPIIEGRTSRSNSMTSTTDNLDARLNRIEQAIEGFSGRMEQLLEPHNEANTEDIRNIDSLAPLNVIKQIQSKFEVPDRSAFDEACDEFLTFFVEHESLCLSLAQNFLETAHLWIVPGGISAIDRDYAMKHPFISCVYLLQALRFDSVYEKQRKILMSICSRITSAAALAAPLPDHDIEAICYVCLYMLSKGALSFDPWILSSVGINHCLLSLDLSAIRSNAQAGIFTHDDLFHLRIFNALCCVNYQNAIGFGRPTFIDPVITQIRKYSVDYPAATVGDAIKLAEIELYELLYKLLPAAPTFTGDRVLTFTAIEDWRGRWDRIIAKDASKVLSFGDHFANIMLSRKVVDKQDSNSAVACNTAYHHSVRTLQMVLDLAQSFFKGCTTFQLNQMVYACVTLFDYMSVMDPGERNMTLNLISKVYWHLNKVGESSNVATTTIANIVKKLVELATNNESLQYEKTDGYVGDGSITEKYVRERHFKRRDSQQQRTLAPEDLPPREQQHRSSLLRLSPRTYSFQSPQSTVRSTQSSTQEFQLPDVANFKSFEDFYFDIFSDLPNATQ